MKKFYKKTVQFLGLFIFSIIVTSSILKKVSNSFELIIYISIVVLITLGGFVGIILLIFEWKTLSDKTRLKLMIFLLFLLILLLGFIFVYHLFMWDQQIPNCGSGEAVYFYWNDYFKKRYDCIPDSNNCESLIKGHLDVDLCEKSPYCKTNCYSSCWLCEDMHCDCIPKD